MGTSNGMISISEVMEKLIAFVPSIKDDRYMNPFIYNDIKKWYNELEKLQIKNETKTEV